MSDPENPEVAVEPPTDEDLFVSEQAREISFDYKGRPIRMKVYEVSRAMKEEALQKAILAYREQYPNDDEMRPLPTVLRRELFKRVIKWWNLKVHPSIAYDRIKDDEFLDRIMDEAGISEVLDDDGGGEVEKAKDFTEAAVAETHA